MKEIFINKTRIAISGEYSQAAFDLLIHIANFLSKEIDYITDRGQHISEKSDFVIFAIDENHTEFLKIHPNIVLITESIKNIELYHSFVETITSGGVLIYHEDNQNLENFIHNTENYFRKITFENPDFQKINNAIFIDTDLGKIPLKISEEHVNYIEGLRILCQQMGIQEEEFYEALLSY